jgi:sulfoxide reductase heme-binding subunit YedZ
VRTATESVHLVAATVGFTSFALLWLSIVWGLVLANGWTMTRMRHSTVVAIHHTVALLGLTLGLVHGLAQMAVPGGPVRWVDQVVPFLNPTDPVGLGLGVVAIELFLAVGLSALVQRRLGHARWRAVHRLTYAAFMLLVGHVLISGSDVRPPVVWVPVLAAWAVTLGLWASTTPWAERLRTRRARRPGEGGRVTAQRRGAGQEITVDVDSRLCGRFGFCEHEAPDVFQLRGDGRLVYRASVPTHEAGAVVRAVEVCPARAIVLGTAARTVTTPPAGTPLPSAQVTDLRDLRERGGRR